MLSHFQKDFLKSTRSMQVKYNKRDQNIKDKVYSKYKILTKRVSIKKNGQKKYHLEETHIANDEICDME